MFLRPATMDDAATLLEWRNDPATCAACVSSEPVSWPDHIRWLRATIANPKRRLLVIERGGEAVATARFDYDEPTEFSFTIAPAWRGRGISRQIISLAISAEANFVAYTKRENKRFQRLAFAAGLRIVRRGSMQLWAHGDPFTFAPEARAYA